MTRGVLQRIVCAVDLSDQSVPSLKRALHLAHLHGAKLLVVDVTDGPAARMTAKRILSWLVPPARQVLTMASGQWRSVR